MAKAPGGGGLGKPGRGLLKLGGPSSKFATTTVQSRPSGPSKLDKRDKNKDALDEIQDKDFYKTTTKNVVDE